MTGRWTVLSIARPGSKPSQTLPGLLQGSTRSLAPGIISYTVTQPVDRETTLARADEDLLVLPQSVYHRYPRFVVFDMDSTLIQQECIDLLASYAGVEDKVSDITRRAMNGELDFTASLAARVALLKGLPETVFQQVRERITFSPGARALCRALSRMGVRMAVISGGFVPLAAYVQKELGIHDMHSNTLDIDPATRTLTGETSGIVVNAERKRELLLQIQKEIGCDIAQVVAVGDGANDLPMLNTAGIGIAIHAKEKVQREAPCRIRFGDLATILHLFDLDADQIEELTRE
ncbi:Phosphoserine phosphatase [Savitreella phatthalungensis]